MPYLEVHLPGVIQALQLLGTRTAPAKPRGVMTTFVSIHSVECCYQSRRITHGPAHNFSSRKLSICRKHRLQEACRPLRSYMSTK